MTNRTAKIIFRIVAGIVAYVMFVAGVSGFVALTFPDQWLGAIKATLLFTGVILGSLAIIGAIAGIVTLWQHIEQKIDEREEGR